MGRCALRELPTEILPLATIRPVFITYVADVYLIGLYNDGSGADSMFDEPPEIWFCDRV